MRTETAVIAGVDVDVSFTYEAPDYESCLNGWAGEYIINKVELNGVDLFMVLSDDTITDIENQLEDGRNCAIDY